MTDESFAAGEHAPSSSTTGAKAPCAAKVEWLEKFDALLDARMEVMNKVIAICNEDLVYRGPRLPKSRRL